MEAKNLWEFWDQFLNITQHKIETTIWENYIQAGLYIRELTDTILVLGASRIYIKNFIENNPHLMSILVSSAMEVKGAPLEVKITYVDTVKSSPQKLVSLEDKVPSPSDLDYETLEKELNSSNTPIYNPPTSISEDYDEDETIVIPIQRSPSTNGANNLYSNDNLYVPNVVGQEKNNDLYEKEDSCSFALNSNYTFHTFVAGNSNRIAFAAAQAVAEMPAQKGIDTYKYNPLFIYGKSGLGKTHLMHAIAHYIQEHHPHLKVMCISCERFTNDLINSIKDKQSESFRKQYRNIDVLLVDDIQFLQAKGHTQEEFFHTFNTLKDDNKQIILSSDTLPKDMKSMEERLRSRFAGALITTIDSPDLETRIAILRSISDREIAKNPHLKIPNDVINYVATVCDDNIRTLEGAFNKVIINASIENKAITLDYAIECLRDIVGDTAKKQLTVGSIQDFIALYFKIKKEVLLSQKRTKQLAHARQIAMFLCRELTSESYPQIASAFGKKDHTTVLHAYEKISREQEQSKELKDMIADITHKLI